MDKCIEALHAKYVLHAAKPVSAEVAGGSVSWAFVLKHYCLAWPLYALNMYLLFQVGLLLFSAVGVLWAACFGALPTTASELL